MYATMKKAQKIYQILAQTRNRAADKALLEALHWAEGSYQAVLLNILLGRGQGRAMAELIRSYHQFGPKEQGILHDRVESLFAGLHSAVSDKDGQTRLNVLKIIQKTQYYRAADVVVGLLRHRNPQIAQLAGTVLRELAEKCVAERPAQRGNSTHKAKQSAEATSYQQVMHKALHAALLQYPRLHQQEEAIQAALIFAPPNEKNFWQDYLHPWHTVCKNVKDVLLRHGGPRTAQFCLSGLGQEALRATAARSISRCRDRDYILELARNYKHDNSEAISKGLQLIKNPVWLDPNILPLAYLNAEEQIMLLQFITSLGVARERIAEYLGGSITELTKPALLWAVEILPAGGDFKTVGWLKKILATPHEDVVLAALDALINIKPTQLAQIMAEQFDSSHRRVRVKAFEYFQEIAFQSYWKSFETLPQEQQIKAGTAVFKVDPEAPQRWQEYARSEKIQDRLQAIRVVRLLGLVGGCLEVIMDMVSDSQAKIRSCAVAGLGEIKDHGNTAVEEYLKKALGDKDARVRANAVEALERRGAIWAVDLIEPLTKSNNNRIRANAIKALLRWRVASARNSIAAMLADGRRAHRLSANWVVENIYNNQTEQQAGGKQEKQNVLAVS